MTNQRRNAARQSVRPTQPTRAVALGYDADKDKAPRIIASGSGYVGEKILELAKANNIPIHQDPLLANALASLEVDETIPPELYQVVAEVLAYVYRIREKYKEKLKAYQKPTRP